MLSLLRLRILSRPLLWRAGIVMLCVLAVATVVGPGAASADPPDRETATTQQLQKVTNRLDDARDALQGVERRRTVTLADIQKIDAERARLDEELARLGGETVTAEARLQRLQQNLAATNHDLIAAEEGLLDSHDDLEARRSVAADRARAAYETGGLGYAEAIFTARSITDITHTAGYLRALVEADREQLNEVVELQHDVDATKADLGSLRDEQAQRRDETATEQARLAALVAEREAVRTRADAAAEAHRAVLTDLDQDRESYTQLAAILEADGAELEDELRAIAETERRAGEGGQDPTTAPVSAPDGRLYPPVPGMTSSNFGWRVHPIFGTRRFHAGMDTGAPTGTPIHAAESGTVYAAGWMGGYGNAVILNHGDGLTTLYAHQSRLGVSTGETVVRGEVIGYVGSTGYSTGPHLHFEVRVDGVPQDPIAWL